MIGRFLQTVPIGYYDSMNLYCYVNNNPGNYTDAMGLAARVRTRPLGSSITRLLADALYGKNNVRGRHWHFEYDDGSDSGYLGDIKKIGGKMQSPPLPIFGPDDKANLSKYDNTLIDNLDSDALKEAEKTVQRQWYEDFRDGRKKYNHPEK